MMGEHVLFLPKNKNIIEYHWLKLSMEIVETTTFNHRLAVTIIKISLRNIDSSNKNSNHPMFQK